jgi:hypothetical protein
MSPANTIEFMYLKKLLELRTEGYRGETALPPTNWMLWNEIENVVLRWPTPLSRIKARYALPRAIHAGIVWCSCADIVQQAGGILGAVAS